MTEMKTQVEGTLNTPAVSVSAVTIHAYVSVFMYVEVGLGGCGGEGCRGRSGGLRAAAVLQWYVCGRQACGH